MFRRGDLFDTMGRPQKQASKHNNGEKNSANVTVTKPITREHTKGSPSIPLEDLDTISEKSMTNPEIEALMEAQILSPTTTLRDLQHQSQVRTEFNAWINGLSAVKESTIAPEVDAEGFVLAIGFSRHRCSQLEPVHTGNSFMVLHSDDDNEEELQCMEYVGAGFLRRYVASPTKTHAKLHHHCPPLPSPEFLADVSLLSLAAGSAVIFSHLENSKRPNISIKFFQIL
ncbi:hypothetical protein SOVF_033810 [Spinacia oleracea]|nr:hypothetical protein SOVF_033810 [Spinacia oleracea]